MKRLGFCAALVAALLYVVPQTAEADESSTWEEIHDDEGIKVWRREVPGSSFVAFRGRGNIQAPIVDVAAVIRNADRAEEWMQDCADGHVVQYKSSVDAVVYNRTGSPAFFINDRDTVLIVKTKIDAKQKLLLVQFDQTKHKLEPVKDGVVRMPKLKGHWKLRQIDVGTTEVEYQVEADPGGALPAWLVNLVSKKLPYHTLRGLRSQVKKTGYDKHRFILLASLDWSAFELPPDPSDSATLSVATGTISKN